MSTFCVSFIKTYQYSSVFTKLINKHAYNGHAYSEISSDRCVQPEELRPLLYTLGIRFYMVIKFCRQACMLFEGSGKQGLSVFQFAIQVA